MYFCGIIKLLIMKRFLLLVLLICTFTPHQMAFAEDSLCDYTFELYNMSFIYNG